MTTLGLATRYAALPADVKLEAAQERAFLRDVMARRLTRDERQIVIRRFGLDRGGHRDTFEEIGDDFGLSGGRIQQLQARALRKLRWSYRQRDLRERFSLAALAAVVLTACMPALSDFAPAENPPPYIWMCDEDGGTCTPYDFVCLEADCRAIPVVEL